jgi:hypothetical protein
LSEEGIENADAQGIVLKRQGAEALSCVEYDANWRFVGDPGRHHFTSARFF